MYIAVPYCSQTVKHLCTLESHVRISYLFPAVYTFCNHPKQFSSDAALSRLDYQPPVRENEPALLPPNWEEDSEPERAAEIEPMLYPQGAQTISLRLTVCSLSSPLTVTLGKLKILRNRFLRKKDDNTRQVS